MKRTSRSITSQRSIAAITTLALAWLIAPVPAVAQNAYITNQVSNNVSVINTFTNTVVATIPVGNGPFGVAVSPDGSKVYVTNTTSLAICFQFGIQGSCQSVSVIDTATNTVVATIPVGVEDEGVAVSPDGSKVYVANEGESDVTVIDTTTNATSVIGINGTNNQPFGVAVTPNGTDGLPVFITNISDNLVFFIVNAVSVGAFSPDFPNTMGTAGIAATPNGSHGYVANFDGNVSLFAVPNPLSGCCTEIVAEPGDPSAFPFGVAVSPDGSKVYVTNRNVNSVSIIDTATNTVSGTITVGKVPQGVAVTPDGSKVLVANQGDDTVSVIATASNTVVATIPVGSSPGAFGIFILQRFAGTIGSKTCNKDSSAALANTFGNLGAAAAAIGYPKQSDLKTAIDAYCGDQLLN